LLPHRYTVIDPRDGTILRSGTVPRAVENERHVTLESGERDGPKIIIFTEDTPGI